MLKRQGALIDTDQEMVDALQVLRREDPDNPLWAEMLGYIRFRRGGWETVDALAQMTAAIRLGAHRVETYLMAAESARLLANHDRAADILRQALKRYPQDMRLRNNLALALSATLDGRQEAMRLAEQVAEQAPEHPDVLDTAALCFLRGRQWDRAEGYTRRLKTAAGNGTRLAVRAGIYEAEIALRRGNPGQAIDMLNALLDQSRLLTDRDVLQLNDLLAEAKVAETRRKPEP
jgi:Tfp pilus assembly protein PilF